MDEITVAERVAALLGEHGALTAERVLYRRLELAGAVEFVHLGAVNPDGTTPSGKWISRGALERHFGSAA